MLRTISSKSQEEVKEEDRDPILSKKEGLNRFAWDLRVAPATKLADKKGGRGDYTVEGPQVPPGTYRAKLSVGKQTFTQTFTVKADPRLTTTSQADLDAQHAFLLKVRDKLNETHAAINRARELRAQAQGWEKRAPALTDEAAGVAKKLTEIEDALIQAKSDDPRSFPARLNVKLGTLINFADNADHAPTQQLLAMYDDIAARIDAQTAKLAELIAGPIAGLNTKIAESGPGAIG